MLPWAYPSLYPNDISIGSAVLHSSRQRASIFSTGNPFPSKLPLRMGDLERHLVRDFLGPPESKRQTASGSLQPFSRSHDCDRQTDRHTDHATRSVSIGRIYIRSTAMRSDSSSSNSSSSSSGSSRPSSSSNVTVCGAVTMTVAIARVHLVHLMNTVSAPTGHSPVTQTSIYHAYQPTWALSCYRPHSPSSFTIIVSALAVARASEHCFMYVCFLTVSFFCFFYSKRFLLC